MNGPAGEPVAEILLGNEVVASKPSNILPNPWLAILWGGGAIVVGWVAVWVAAPLLIFPIWYVLADPPTGDMYAAFKAFHKTPVWMAGGTLIMQGAAALFVYWRARRDPSRAASEQLGLGRGRVGLWAWPIFFLASFIVSWIGAIVMWLGQRAGVLPTAAPLFDRDMQVLAGLSGLGAILVAFLIGPAAGIGEELVMRGYLQRRLMRRWPVWRSIVVTSLLFAAFHLDISHIVGILPVGVWFGYIAWRADSIRPTMAVHGAIDVMYFLMALVPDIGQSLRDYTMPLSMLSVVCLPVSIVILERAGREDARRPGAPDASDAD